MTVVVKLDLTFQCLGQVYVIIVIHIYLLKKTITIANTETAENPDKRNKKVNLQKIMLHLVIANAEKTISKYMMLMILI